jgi:DNA-binding MarR family transcriptional regulator
MIVKLNPVEMRIYKILQEWYPITVEELKDELRMREDTLLRSLKSMSLKGVVALEPLSDKTYVRLLMSDVKIASKGRRPKTGDAPDDFYDALVYQ